MPHFKKINSMIFIIFMFGIADVALAAQGYNTTRSNRSTAIDSSGGVDTPAPLHGKRKCIKSGGAFLEYADSTRICIPKAQAKSQTSNGDMIANISDKRKCWRDGGVWQTNSTGSFCLNRLKSHPSAIQ